MAERWDVLVIGGGHAGCEAALAAARMGRRTLLLTGDLDAIARLSCNPSMGGPAKGHLVREIAALGGAMAHVTDRTAIQVRLLNSGKGPAVQALRAQLDKDLYPATMRDVLSAQAGLELRAAMVTGLLLDADPGGSGRCSRVAGVVTANGERVVAQSVVVTTGTFLNGRMIAGERITPGGRVGEAPAEGLSAQFAAAGLRLGRLKTGTPPRIEARSIDFGRTQVQPGSRGAALVFLRAAGSPDVAGADTGTVVSGGRNGRLAGPDALLSGPHQRRDARGHSSQSAPGADVQRAN